MMLTAALVISLGDVAAWGCSGEAGNGGSVIYHSPSGARRLVNVEGSFDHYYLAYRIHLER